MTELKLCPFCGGCASVLEDEFEASRVFFVSCDNCGAATGLAENKQTVIDNWNKRIDLAPCPFCGGKASVCVDTVNNKTFFAVICESCGIISQASDDENEVVAAWNKRTP